MKLIDTSGFKTMKARRIPTPSMREDEKVNLVPVVPVIAKRGEYLPFDATKEVFDFVNGDHTEGEVPNGLDFQRDIEATVYFEDFKAKVFNSDYDPDDDESQEFFEKTKQRIVCLDLLQNPLYARSLKGANKEKFPDFVELYVHPHGSIEVLRQPVNTQVENVRRAILELRQIRDIKKGQRILEDRGKVIYTDEELIRLDLNSRKKGNRIY